MYEEYICKLSEGAGGRRCLGHRDVEMHKEDRRTGRQEDRRTGGQGAQLGGPRDAGGSARSWYKAVTVHSLQVCCAHPESHPWCDWAGEGRL